MNRSDFAALGAMALAGGTNQTMMVGVEDNDDGSLRVYVGHRYKGLYVVAVDDEAKDAVRRAWGQGGHVFMPMPSPDQIFSDADVLSISEQEEP